MDEILEDALRKERIRQEENVELIASENYVSNDILKLQGSILTNKYAEGYPRNRYYGGCENVDIIEKQAIKYAKDLFHSKYVNVQPHSGSSANMAVFKALLNHGDKIMGMDLSCGGHLTHGHKASFSGMDYNVISYSVDPTSHLIDYLELEKKVLHEKPKLVIAGGSAYSRYIDFKKFREICDKVGAYLMVDMAHIAGLVAAGIHPSPIPYADVVTSTTHKTLRGPRGGFILTNSEEIAKKIDKTVFPGIQGGPLMHVIAAKAQCFYEALQPEFIEYQKNVVKNSKVLLESLKEEGFVFIGDKTDNHLMVMDVKSSVGITGTDAESILEKIHITTNKNVIPFDTLSPSVTSGLRIGTAAMTTRGFGKSEFRKLGKIIASALKNDSLENLEKLDLEVKEMMHKFPLWY